MYLSLAFMVASARFRRMFTSGGGYTAFMPAIIKVYAESELNQGIRAAIEYAVGRFYSLHQEAFVFQSLDAVSHIAMMPTVTDRGLRIRFSLSSPLSRIAPLNLLRMQRESMT